MMGGLPVGVLGPLRLWRLAWRPGVHVPVEAARPRGPLARMAGFLAWRIPFGVLGALGTWRGLEEAWGALRRLEGPWGQVATAALPDLRPEDLAGALGPMPTLARAFPWLLGAVPLGLLGEWLHHAVWDHGCLWMLRGLRKEHPWRATFEAEALALQVGAVGSVLGLASFLPGLGPYLWPLSAVLGLWFWGLRGVALAAFHGCPVWKGVLATLLHALLLGAFMGLLVLLALLAVGLPQP